MLKLLAAPDPAPALAAMQAVGILQAVIPGADAAAMAVLVHLESETNTAPNAIRRLALLGGEEVAERLRLSRTDARRRETLRAAAADPMPAAERGYRLGRIDGGDSLLIRAAWLGMAPEAAEWQELERGAEARFPVTPADLMPGLSGPALGQRLREIEARWIASGFRLGREDLL
jgi:poly(A) polymerase